MICREKRLRDEVNIARDEILVEFCKPATVTRKRTEARLSKELGRENESEREV